MGLFVPNGGRYACEYWTWRRSQWGKIMLLSLVSILVTRSIYVLSIRESSCYDSNVLCSWLVFTNHYNIWTSSRVINLTLTQRDKSNRSNLRALFTKSCKTKADKTTFTHSLRSDIWHIITQLSQSTATHKLLVTVWNCNKSHAHCQYWVPLLLWRCEECAYGKSRARYDFTLTTLDYWKTSRLYSKHARPLIKPLNYYYIPILSICHPWYATTLMLLL